MRAAVRYEILLTPLVPKYSLMISEVTKTTGQLRTPAVMLKSSMYPKIFSWAGLNPNVASAEKIFAPMISAMMALVRKIPQRIR